jgi:hypothetical protein
MATVGCSYNQGRAALAAIVYFVGEHGLWCAALGAKAGRFCQRRATFRAKSGRSGRRCLGALNFCLQAALLLFGFFDSPA